MTSNPPTVPVLRATASKSALAIMTAALMLAAFSGCSIPNLRCPTPGRSLPTDFVGETTRGNSARVGVDEFFGDPVLSQLIAEGMAGNQELKIRNEEIQIANNEIILRRGQLLPFVVGEARGGFDKNSRFTPLGAAEEQLTYPTGRPFPDPVPNVALKANLFWQIDIWHELRNARDAAIQRYNEAIDARDFYITQLAAEIAENYYELAALDQRLRYLEQTIEIQRQSEQVARDQKAAARGNELPVQRFLAEVRKNESQQFIVRQRIVEVENRINFLLGRYPQPVARTTWEFVRLDSRLLQVGVPAELLANRRDIRAAERELQASGLDILVARARFFPRFDITASVGVEAFNPRYLFDPGSLVANLAGDLIGPVINKSAIRADYQNANARQLQALYDYQRTVLNAYVQVVNQMSKVEKYRESVATKAKQVVALEQSVSVASDLFSLSSGEFSDVLFSQRDLLEARVTLVETKQEQLVAIVDAYQALGGGFRSANLPIATVNLLILPEPVVPPRPDDSTVDPDADDVTVPPVLVEPAEDLPGPADPSSPIRAVPLPADNR